MGPSAGWNWRWERRTARVVATVFATAVVTYAFSFEDRTERRAAFCVSVGKRCWVDGLELNFLQSSCPSLKKNRTAPEMGLSGARYRSRTGSEKALNRSLLAIPPADMERNLSGGKKKSLLTERKDLIYSSSLSEGAGITTDSGDSVVEPVSKSPGAAMGADAKRLRDKDEKAKRRLRREQRKEIDDDYYVSTDIEELLYGASPRCWEPYSKPQLPNPRSVMLNPEKGRLLQQRKAKLKLALSSSVKTEQTSTLSSEPLCAYVSVITCEDFLPGAQVLAASLRQVNSTYPAVILYSNNVSANAIEILESFGWIPYEVDLWGSDTDTFFSRSYFTKLHIFRLPLQRLIYLDLDVLILRNIDSLFHEIPGLKGSDCRRLPIISAIPDPRLPPETEFDPSKTGSRSAQTKLLKEIDFEASEKDESVESKMKRLNISEDALAEIVSNISITHINLGELESTSCCNFTQNRLNHAIGGKDTHPEDSEIEDISVANAVHESPRGKLRDPILEQNNIKWIKQYVEKASRVTKVLPHNALLIVHPSFDVFEKLKRRCSKKPLDRWKRYDEGLFGEVFKGSWHVLPPHFLVCPMQRAGGIYRYLSAHQKKFGFPDGKYFHLIKKGKSTWSATNILEIKAVHFYRCKPWDMSIQNELLDAMTPCEQNYRFYKYSRRQFYSVAESEGIIFKGNRPKGDKERDSWNFKHLKRQYRKAGILLDSEIRL